MKAGKRSILLFWALLMVPVLILAAVAARLLSHEQDRLSQAHVNALMDQARAAAGQIDLAMETVQGNLTDALLEIPIQNLEQTLLGWEKENPLVRNVFIYIPKQGLKYPLKSMAATREERQFVNRFSPLFSGRIPFDYNRAVREDAPAAAGRSSRTALYALSRQTAAPAHGNWIPWFSDNRLYILGWVEKQGTIYGIELEMMTVLSRLAGDFPAPAQEGAALVLADGSGSPLILSGTAGIDRDPQGRLPVSPRLPHWSLAVYMGDFAPSATQGFTALALMILAILLTAIVTGGIMITRLTLANIRDARRKTSFVASVSHELKTPLTSIRMYAELLQSGRIKDPDKQARYLEVIVGESGRLTRLVNNVLDFGRLEQGQKSYTPTDFDLKEFLEEIIAIHGPRLENDGFEITKEFVSGPVPVFTDRDAMEQVLLNLMDNALKYADSGRFIRFSLVREADTILIRIQDRGPGIPADAAHLIFEKFYRGDTSLTAAKPGSGLGLSIARQMLRDLGGDLYLDPSSGPDSRQNPAPGSCFTIRIPNERIPTDETH